MAGAEVMADRRVIGLIAGRGRLGVSLRRMRGGNAGLWMRSAGVRQRKQRKGQAHSRAARDAADARPHERLSAAANHSVVNTSPAQKRH